MDHSHPSQSLKSPAKPFQLVIVDDHAVVRQGTRNMLDQIPEIDVIAECADGDALLELLKSHVPHLLLLDINLPGKNGFQLLAELKPQFPQLKIILFSAHTEMQYLRKAQQLHADGYFSKTMTETELKNALLQVALQPSNEAVEWVVSPDITALLKQSTKQDSETQLTARELEILSHLVQGTTNQAIAKALCLSVKTVDTHVANLIKKTGVRNRTQLLAYAYEHQLL